MKNRIPVIILTIAVLISACSPIKPTPSEQEPTTVAVLPTQEPIIEILPTPISGGGVPGGVLQAKLKLAESLKIPVEQVEVTGITPKDWPDSCLGLPVTGEICAEVITPGFEVVLTAGAAQYQYRTDAGGKDIRAVGDIEPATGSEKNIPLFEWTGSGCEVFSVTTQGAFYGKCGETLAAVAGVNPGMEPVKNWIKTFAPFDVETSAGKVKFSGLGENTAGYGKSIAMPADQRMIAEWARLQFDTAQAGRSGAAWGLALSYHIEGGIAGFCDDLGIYLDGRVQVSSCKGLNTTLYLTTSEMQQVYDWYGIFAPVDYSYSDPAVADKMTTILSMPGQGQKTAAESDIRAMLDFLSMLDARAAFSVKADAGTVEAEQNLVNYFKALNSEDFVTGAKLYGGSVELLQTWNPDIKNNLPAWLEQGCKHNGLNCLLPRSIRYRGPDERSGYQFLVEFNLPDGRLFTQGPCCGETSGTGISSFLFGVVRSRPGWQVLDLPPYTP